MYCQLNKLYQIFNNDQEYNANKSVYSDDYTTFEFYIYFSKMLYITYYKLYIIYYIVKVVYNIRNMIYDKVIQVLKNMYWK